MLLLYDAYRSHMSLESLTILEEGGVIAFALPAHTSGTTQPLDAGLFQPFKNEINRVIDTISPVSDDAGLDIFDLCKVLKRSYEDVFIPYNMRKAFMKSGVHPFNPMKYLGVPRPFSQDQPHSIVSVEDLERMLKAKQEEYRNNQGVQKVVMKRGFVDTSTGLQLTSKAVMEKVANKEAVQRKKYVEKEVKLRAAELSLLTEKRKRRNARAFFERTAMVYRHRAYGDQLTYPRSLELRRKLARERTALKEFATGYIVPKHDENGPWNECSVDQYEYPTP